ncbi:alkaline phosphatase family protein [Porphyromonas circumdentaria]|uniref:Type I phosphodiesterase / nucleotide pyrophosphatase n=1 Tax=Porphyromonas circumdentaria TaxID=29524 RepID=A0A1T4MG16_9PORP|nr:alkaline phosphatase family protein [Porphyromonas circumdentaria]MBB6275772.1 hypothetical protein [Porphyromonas circumdentaria]SJZ65805.1 Type I phosphodiesterase / nucleotide pyrophosphatase [Porphyromonas circumdentaria]
MNKKNRLTQLLSSLIVLSALSSQPTKAQEVPKLLLYIHLTGVDVDILESYQHYFGDQGINRLIKEGTLFRNADYEYPITHPTQALATLMTGAYPTHHLIGLGTDYKTLLQSKKHRGINTSEKISPEHLTYETVGNVLLDLTQNKSRVYSIAANAQEALITSGSSASGAFWIDDISGLWASSSWYTFFPKSFSNINNGKEALRERIHALKWSGEAPTRFYLPYSREDKETSFSYSFTGGHLYKSFKKTPLVNEEITRFTKKILSDLSQSEKDFPSVVNVIYNLSSFKGSSPLSVYSIEAIDSYFRTDKTIGELLRSAETFFGQENCIVFLSTVPNTSPRTEGSSAPKTIYSFSTQRCQALTNLYLSALYGKADWVLRVTPDALYLDRALIERKGLSLREVQRKAASFVKDFEGVDYTYATRTTEEETQEVIARRLHHLLPRSTNIDVLIGLHYATKLIDQGEQRVSTYPVTIPPAYSWLIATRLGGKGREIRTPVRMVSIASTLSYILRIRPPTQAIGAPIQEILQMSK